MRKLLFILLLLPFISKAQAVQYIGAPNTKVESRGQFQVDSLFFLPQFTDTIAGQRAGALIYRTADKKVYYFTGTKWLLLGPQTWQQTLITGSAITQNNTVTNSNFIFTYDSLRLNLTHPYHLGTLNFTGDTTAFGATYDFLRVNQPFIRSPLNTPWTYRSEPADNGDGTIDFVMKDGFNIGRSYNVLKPSFHRSMEYGYQGNEYEYHNPEFQNVAAEVMRLNSIYLLDEGTAATTSCQQNYEGTLFQWNQLASPNTTFMSLDGGGTGGTTFSLNTRDGVSAITIAPNSASTGTTITGNTTSQQLMFNTWDRMSLSSANGFISTSPDPSAGGFIRARNNHGVDFLMTMDGSSAGGIYNDMAEIFPTTSGQLNRLSWGGLTYRNTLLIGDYGNYTPITTGSYGVQLINRTYVAASLKLNDTLQMPNIISKTIDTTTYKPLVINSAGGVFKMATWPAGGGGGSQNLQQVLTTGSTLTGDNTITNTSHKLTLSGGEYDITTGTLAADGSQFALNLTATIPGTPTADIVAEQHIVTAAGSANHAIIGFENNLIGSYTGTNETDAAFFGNFCAGHGTHSISNNGTGNFAFQAQSVATTIGSNVGLWAEAGLGNKNFAIEGISVRDKASTANVAVTGDASNNGASGIAIGGYFGIGNGLSDPAASAALLVDQGGTSVPAVRIFGIFSANGNDSILVHGTDSTIKKKSFTSLLTLNNVTSGTYTPTLFNTTNITSTTAQNATWTRVGNVITVDGSFDVTTTLAVASVVGISLPGPGASAFGAATDLNGLGSAETAIASNIVAKADTGNQRAQLNFIGLSVGGSGRIYYHFAYTYIAP